jgi:putative ABC transport system permease protein
VLQDLRFTFRLIAKERWFSAVAIVALALGIGVNAIGFTVINAVFLRGLPYKDADRLYLLAWQTRSGSRVNLSPAELQDWRAQNRAFDGLAAFTDGTMNISDDRALPEQARGASVTANAFRVLGQAPILGRDFADGEDRVGAEPLVIIGSGIWKNRYGSDPNVIGRGLRVNGQRATIVGVMPDSMKFPFNTEIWALLVPADAVARDARVLNVFGRLRAGTAVAGARAELNGIAARLAAAYPDVSKDLVGVRVETFVERFVGGKAKVVFPAVMGAVCFVLLIACVNVANLLLSRSAYRAREIAVRLALGATRWRVVRQLLLESLVLGFIGGGIGLLIAVGGARLIDAGVQDPGKPFWIAFTVDGVVFGYVAATCVVTAMLFGLAPALHVSKTNLNDVLKEGGRGSAGNRRVRWLSGAMIVTELALTIVLLAGAGLMIRSLMKIDALDIGIRTDHLTAMRMELKDSKYATVEARRAFYERLEPRLAAIPGVESIAVTTAVPPFGAGQRSMEIEGRTAEGQPLSVATVTVSPRFFDVAGVSLLHGRSFGDIDGVPGSETVIVNERMVAQFFKGEDAIGRRLRFVPRQTQPAPPFGSANRAVAQGRPAPVWRTIVGVSPSIRHGSFQDGEANAVVYVPYRQEPPGGGWVLIRSQLPPGSVMDAVRHGVQAVDQDQPVFTIQTVEQMVELNLGPLRVFGTLFVILGAIALALSAVGLYGVMAYSVTERTREIGVRMALGALGRQVSWMILKRGLVQLALGLSIGLAGALALSRLLRSVLIQIAPSDPITFATITMLLTAVSIAACLLPARRATHVDPLVALRAE